ncbi:MAG: hypothetical protein SVK08_01775 [Halobacteriota archaeon]|nr:hypothetical protein [Halobacteriota archaeon]
MNLFLDSGAYSAWTSRNPVSLKEYGKFILEHIDMFDAVANLDVIPGEFGRKGTPEELEESARLGYENYWKLIEMGAPKEKLVHIFHQDEEFHWLERMVSEMEYIGISPANDRTVPQKRKWLDQCMEFVIKEDGYPKLKLHAFGLTSIPLLRAYPWFSADSTSWLYMARYGAVFVPKSDGRFYDYTRSPYSIFFSVRSAANKIEGKHYKTLSKIEQEYLVKYIENKGFKLQDAIDSGLVRDQLNMMYYMDLEASMPPWPWRYRRNGQKGLF